MEMDRNILVRYFLGQCTESEKETIRQWMESDEAHKKEFIRERIRFDASLIVDENELLAPARPTLLLRRGVRRALRIAAVVALVVCNGVLLRLYLSQSAEQSSLQSIHVPTGSRTSITLPDGTTVWLNSNTNLVYPNSFTGDQRIVELDGEAYFDVARNEAKPFIVKTDKYNVEVLGTAFNMEAYSAQSNFKTTLCTGKVRLFREENLDESLYLNPGEAAELIDGQLRIVPANGNIARWKDGLIVLDGQSFEEIVELFRKYYESQIVIRNENVRNLQYEGKLRITDGIDHALRVLQNDSRFTYRREEETNTIYIE